jgi:hypothetical protein
MRGSTLNVFVSPSGASQTMKTRRLWELPVEDRTRRIDLIAWLGSANSEAHPLNIKPFEEIESQPLSHE